MPLLGLASTSVVTTIAVLRSRGWTQAAVLAVYGVVAAYSLGVRL